MKKGTTIESGYDNSRRWCLKLRKAKGKSKINYILSAKEENR